ncbi:hypothetical protein Tco_0968396 [Tanacetum coccineum]
MTACHVAGSDMSARRYTRYEVRISMQSLDGSVRGLDWRYEESKAMIGSDPEPMIGVDDSCQLLEGVRVGL